MILITHQRAWKRPHKRKLRRSASGDQIRVSLIQNCLDATVIHSSAIQIASAGVFLIESHEERNQLLI